MFDLGALPDGQPYYIMELVEGLSLTDYIRERAPVSLSRALTIIAETAEGLHAAHRLGVIHRDVKPENILVTIDGHAKPIDFGIAKHQVDETEGPAARLTRERRVPGTAKYLSPEQAMAQPLTPASDLYSLGCVTAAMLEGAVQKNRVFAA